MDLISLLFLVVMVDPDDIRQVIDDGGRTMPRVWHNLPTGELKINNFTLWIGHWQNVNE